MTIRTPYKNSVWVLLFLACLLVCAGVIAVFGKGLFQGSDIFFKAVRDPNPFVSSYAWHVFNREALLDGRFPLWNPWNATGTPHVANYQSGFFSPLLWPLFFLPLSVAAAPYLVLRLMIAGLGAALYLRRIGLGRASCVMGAVAFGLSGWMIQYFNNQHIVIDLLIPYILLFIERLRHGGRLLDFLALLALTALALAGGQPASALFTIGFCGAYLLIISWRDLKPLWIFALAGTLAFMLSLAQLLPFFELLPLSWTYHTPGWGRQHLDIGELITLMAPGFFGFTSDNRVPIMAQLPYIGVVPAALCLAGLLSYRRVSRQGIFFIASIIVCLAFLHGLPGFIYVMSLPGLDRLSFFKYLQPLLTFSAAALSAIALERVFKTRLAVICVGIFALVFLALQLNRFEDGRIFAAGATALVVVQLAAFQVFSKRKWLVVLLALAGLVADSRFNRPNYYFNPEKHDYSFLERFAGKAPGFFRCAATPEVFSPNHGARFGVSDLRLTEVLFFKRYINLLKLINSQTDDEMKQSILAFNYTRVKADPSCFGSDAAERAGLRWFLSRTPVPPNRTIHKVLADARILAPGRDYVLAGLFDLRGDARPVLYQHPPSSLLLEPGSLPLSGRAMGALALDEKTWGLAGDGAWFLAEGNGALNYSRYLDPRHRAGERRWVPVEFDFNPSKGLKFCTLPGRDHLNDWCGWGDLRLNGEPAESGRLYRGIRIYENQGAFNRAHFAEEVLWVNNADESLSALSSGVLDNGAVVMEAGGRDYDGAFSRGELHWLFSGPEHIRLGVSAPDTTALVLRQSCFPGWQAMVDGRESRILPADHVFQGIMVPGGSHVVDFYYRPVAFRIGLWISVASLLWLVFIAPVFRFSR